MHHPMLLTTIFILFMYCLILLLLAQGKEIHGFVADLIHRDSPISPIHNHSASSSELVINSLRRSFDQAKSNHFYSSSISLNNKYVLSQMDPLDTTYTMNIYIGLSRDKIPFVVPFVVVTGNHLTWVKCNPKKKKTPGSKRLYERTSSITYKDILFQSLDCQEFPNTYPGGNNNDLCGYRYEYTNGDFTTGISGVETIYLENTDGSLHELKSFKFGCSYKNRWKLDEDDSLQGIVGLGSFANQIKNVIQHKFSYCLISPIENVPSKIIFGPEGKSYDTETSSTPMAGGHSTLGLVPYYYKLTLMRITVNGESTQTVEEEGNMMIDTGIDYTLLRPTMYDELEYIVKTQVRYMSPLIQTPVLFKLCYDLGEVKQNIQQFNSLQIIFEFADHGNVHVPHSNIFVEIGGYYCLAILKGNEEYAVFGNKAQVNFKVEYDLLQRRVYFTRTDCKRFPQLPA